jgi:hypothetical protein
MKKKTKENFQEIELSKKFVPDFWELQDGRLAIVKMIRERYDDLKRDTQADSVQKDLLCRRATFLSLRLEALEISAMKTGKLNNIIYTKLVTSLVSVLRCLGFDRKAKRIKSLQDYVNMKTKKNDGIKS